MLEGHTSKVWSVAWNPASGTDGKPAILASCGADKTWFMYIRVVMSIEAFLYIAHNSQTTIEGGGTRTGRSCSWSPDGDMLAITSYDGSFSIWKMIEDDFEQSCILQEKDDEEVVSVSWNPHWDLATCSGNCVRIWSPSSESEGYESLPALEEHTEDVEMVQWHPNQNNLFSCGCDSTIKSQERGGAMKLLLRKEKAHEADVNSGQLDPKDKSEPMLEMPLAKKRMDVMNLRERQDEMMQYLFPKKEARKVEVTAVQWSPKGSRLLASSSDNGTIKIWEFTPRQ
ncbi:hypothetical protein DCAR_0625602 [Daucus carota subsp. sativus]|uniref:Uncharacterized protein n=1 Tax=Daucus carota subsp. sativus TaxID=79200 RepID=A0A164WK84_DAUCS|nr:hypothetical protein DCAR_0625602 [Daucus carota subsp. sativus]